MSDKAFFCQNQERLDDGSVVCLAHLVEDRVLCCPYESCEDAMTRKYRCMDVVPVVDGD